MMVVITSPGDLAVLDNIDLQFGLISSTKMACKNMKLTNQFLEALVKVRHYRIENLHLSLLNDSDDRY